MTFFCISKERKYRCFFFGAPFFTDVRVSVFAFFFALEEEKRTFCQLIEGNFLTPKLVGNSVGLHPVSLLLALSIFGSIFGLVGMIVAVPVAASIGVIFRFLINQYRNSQVYIGEGGK